MTNRQLDGLAAKAASCVLALLLAGCIYLPAETEAPAPPVAAEPPPPPVAEPPPVAAEPAARPAPAPAAERPVKTAVLLSDDIPAYAAIAEQIRERADGDSLSFYNLDGNPANARRIKAEAADADRLVAIGLLAASVGREIDGKPMVFCQVFNYQDYDLISPVSKGVNLLPPFDAQLDAWTSLSPGLERVGVITGPDQESLIGEIRAATDEQGIDLTARTVLSDKEALYAFRRLIPEIQGLWLVPDNRILGPEAVREIMAYSARHQIQVVVFGSNLLGMGALMSVSGVEDDVAEQVLSRLDEIGASGKLAGPDMLPLTRVHVEVNREVARYLGLDVAENIARLDPSR